MNYKIKVDGNIEELTSLFIALGCKYFNHTVTEKNYMIVENGNGFFCKLKSNFKKSECKEISIDQLKDMVVLKRNMISDATHENTVKQKLLKVSSGWYIFNTLLDVWEWNGEYLVYQPTELKPIIKEPVMKEFLEPMPNGDYRYHKNEGFCVGVVLLFYGIPSSHNWR